MVLWIEISLIEHWGPQPHGIPRVAQNVFLQSLRGDVEYFYYDRELAAFVATPDLQYFKRLAAGEASYRAASLPGGVPFAPAPCDHVVFSEGGWDHAGYLGAVQAIRAAHPQVRLMYLLCDLIAIKFPHFFEEAFGGRVRDFLTSLPSFCDRYLCISESTARDVREILDPAADTRVFFLGSDIATIAGDTPPPSRPYALCVGTVEIRKNHILLYYVWRRLALELGAACPRLVIVGRPGWIAGDAMYQLKHDPVLAGLIEFRHDVENTELVSLLLPRQP